MFLIDFPFKSLQFPTFLLVHPLSGVRGQARTQGKRLLEMLIIEGDGPKKWIVITSIPGQYKDEVCANHG